MLFAEACVNLHAFRVLDYMGDFIPAPVGDDCGQVGDLQGSGAYLPLADGKRDYVGSLPGTLAVEPVIKGGWGMVPPSS